MKLKLIGDAAMYVKDYIYGKNQIIDSSHTEFTILSCEMQYKNNIINFVLGFGGDCEVLEPEWLKEEVVNKAQVIIAKNKK